MTIYLFNQIFMIKITHAHCRNSGMDRKVKRSHCLHTRTVTYLGGSPQGSPPKRCFFKRLDFPSTCVRSECGLRPAIAWGCEHGDPWLSRRAAERERGARPGGAPAWARDSCAGRPRCTCRGSTPGCICYPLWLHLASLRREVKQKIRTCLSSKSIKFIFKYGQVKNQKTKMVHNPTA